MPFASTTSDATSVVARLASELLDGLPATTDRLVAMVRDSDASYGVISEDELRNGCLDNLRRTLVDLAERRPVSNDVARATARRRAEQGVPVGSVLHAFRLGFTVIWDAMVERASAAGEEEWRALALAATEVWAVIDAHSAVVTSAYRDRLMELARRDERQRTLLLDALLEGRMAEWTMLNGSLRSLGLPDRGPYVATSAEVLTVGTEPLVRVEQALRSVGIASAWRLRAGEQIGIVAIAGLTLRDVVHALANLAVGRVGISRVFQEVTDTARAVEEAELARRTLPEGMPGVRAVDDDPLAAIVAASPAVALCATRLLLGGLLDISASERESLLETLTVWFACEGRTGESGDRLFCHRNTIRNRLRRIEELTGRSLSNPRSVAELYVAATTLAVVGQGALDI